MNKITLIFFATLRDRAGTKSATLDVPDDLTVRELKNLLTREYPSLHGAIGTALIAVNREYAQDDATLPANAEVAVFPPVSGGAGAEVREAGS